MLASKKKISRREIKQDKLVENYFKVKNFYLDHPKIILGTAGAIVLIVFVVIFLINKSKENAEIANTQLAGVLKLYDQGTYQQAIDGVPAKNIRGLKSIVEDYGSTESGETAKLYLANSYMFLGNLDEALKYYDDYSGDIDLMKAAAYAGIAICYEAKNNLKYAAEYFMKAANVMKNAAVTPEYLTNAARAYSQIGEKIKAKKILDQMKKDFPDSQFARDYDRYTAEFQI
jgi:tetratricopeptide (TPR) repeat protein